MPGQKGGQTTKRTQGILYVFARTLRMYGRSFCPSKPCVSLSIEGNINKKTTPNDLFMRCHYSLSKKASQSFASADAKALLYVFCRDMCVAENTLRGVSVELSAISGQQRRRTQRSFLEKVVKPLFRQSQTTPHDLFMRCHYIHGYSLICCPETSSRSSRPRPSAPRAADSGSDADSPRPCRRGQAPSAYPAARADTAPKTLP